MLFQATTFVVICYSNFQFSSVQSLSCVRLFATPWITAHQASLSITNSQSSLKLISTESHKPSNHIILCQPLLFLPSIFPASGSLPMSQLSVSGGQTIGALAPVLPMNIQGWFHLGLADLISFQSKGFSRLTQTPQFESIDSLVLSLLYGPTLTLIHDYRKNHSFD